MMTVTEYYRPWMGLKEVQEVLPFFDSPKSQRTINNWVRLGFVKLDEMANKESEKGKGIRRKYSVNNCIELAVLWSLTSIGYKPSAILNIIKLTVARAEHLATSFSGPEEITFDEWPLLIFYESNGLEIGPLRGVSAPANKIGAWVADPSAKEARKIAKIVEGLTGTIHGSIMGFFVFQADYIIGRTLDGYRSLKIERQRS